MFRVLYPVANPRRCERAGCARFAVRSNSLGSARKNTLCSLHTQEDRVGLEGLAFVLLALAEARRRGPRRVQCRIDSGDNLRG